MSDAAKLVDQAREWATQYGKYANGVEGAVLTVPLRVRAAWERGDVDAIADLFAEDGSMLAGDLQLTDREGIRTYLAEAFAGPLKGSRLTGEPVLIQLLDDEVAMAVTEGGVAPAGQGEPTGGDRSRTVWIAQRTGGDWRLVSYQSSPFAS